MNRRGYTLVEIMIATLLTLVMMAAVVQVFGMIGEGIRNARSALEMTEELRQAANRLKADLEGVTVKMSPPRESADNEGYFEYTEGPIGPELAPNIAASDTDQGGPDTTAGDFDDVLMFTTRSNGEPFIGRCAGGAIESHEAEVAWFVRGRTLYRRVLLVAPTAFSSPFPAAGFYANNDISVRPGPIVGGVRTVLPNTLGDLTKPENRFSHQVYHYGPPWAPSNGYPSHPHFYVDYSTQSIYPTPWSRLVEPTGAFRPGLGLPTLAECTSQKIAWVAGAPIWPVWPSPSAPDPNSPIAPRPIPPGFTQNGTFDLWRNPYMWQQLSPTTGTILGYHNPEDLPAAHATRVGEDVILNNVLSFDVKVWDPGAPVFLVVATGQVVTPADSFAPAGSNLSPYSQVLGRYLGDTNPQRADAPVRLIGHGAYVDVGYRNSYYDPGPRVTYYTPHRNDSYGLTPHFAASVSNAIGFSHPLNNPKLLSFYGHVYDTWSTHYEEGGPGRDGFDNNGIDGVDDIREWSFPPPYSAPLRGIQIKIRVYEPSSRQIREVTVVQEFVSK